MARGRVLLPDFEEIAEAIRSDEASNLSLAIVRDPSIREPLTERFRRVGVRSLRDVAGDPVEVWAPGQSEASPQLVGELERLRTTRVGNELKKRLDDLELEPSLLWTDWQARLSKIQRVVIADGVTAKYQIEAAELCRGRSIRVRLGRWLPVDLLRRRVRGKQLLRSHCQHHLRGSAKILCSRPERVAPPRSGLEYPTRALRVELGMGLCCREN